jgi:hypothetical protein
LLRTTSPHTASSLSRKPQAAGHEDRNDARQRGVGRVDEDEIGRFPGSMIPGAAGFYAWITTMFR